MPEVAHIHSRIAEGGINFHLFDQDGSPIRLSDWGTYHCTSPSDEPASIAPLVDMVEETLLEDPGADSVLVPHQQIEQISEAGVKQLHLPPAAPLRLRLRGEGLLNSPQFRFRYQLVHGDGTPVMGAERIGAILNVGRRAYTLLYPLYSLLEGIDAFNSLPPDSQEERFLKWSELSELLPDDAQVDEQLRSMNIVRADSFTLDMDAEGEIAPVLRHRRTPARNVWDEEEQQGDETYSSEDALPTAAQRSFAARFQRSSSVQARYAAEGNWYIAVPPSLRKGLEVVKRYQSAPLGERLAFMANPMSMLRDALGNALSEEEVETLFEETPLYLSQRIQCLGEWEPKSFSYTLQSATSWFPEEIGAGVAIDLGGSVLPVAVRDLPALVARMQDAQTSGASSIDYKGQDVPVDAESIGRVEAAAQQWEQQVPSTTDDYAESRDEEAPTDQEDPGTPKRAAVPVISDNLESLGYSHCPHPPRGEAGGMPAALRTTTLYPHQRDGIHWLQEHWAVGSSGALLADDMGLGKTLQALAFLAWVQERSGNEQIPHRPLLIVAPTGLLKNWEAEAEIHLSEPGLGRLTRAYGRDLRDLGGLSVLERRRKLREADWVMTTYETLRDRVQYFIDVQWGVVVFDEVQKIKTPTSLIHDMAKSVSSDFFLALTGTPVENRLGDIWAIIDTIAPGQLGTLKEFQGRYENGSDPDSTGESRENRLRELRDLLFENPPPPRVMRRLKADHLSGLPSKSENQVRKFMPPAQAEAYSEVIAQLQDPDGPRVSPREALQRIRRVSLIAETPGDAGLTDREISQSARLGALMELLDGIAESGEKVLIFVEYLEMQRLLAPYLQQRYGLDAPPMCMSGSTPGSRRQQMVDRFQSSEHGRFDAMLLSPKAGGVGLTLTAANHVIHLSRWWNPAVEDQCTDRVYRIGQERSVNIHYPMAIHPVTPDSSFDVNLHALLDRKRRLSRELLSPSDASRSELDELLGATINSG